MREREDRMYKVLVPGVLPPEGYLCCKCSHCGCVFEFLISAASLELDRGSKYYRFSCPTKDCPEVCRKKVPDHMRKA